MSATTLTNIFDSHKEELAAKLKGLSLPRDSKEVEKRVSEFLNEMFENDGDYRQSLTQSEDYILQCAIQLIYAQQSIAAEIIGMSSSLNASPDVITDTPSNPYYPIIGAGVGAIAGSMLGTWGAIGGAIAGTAVAVYLSSVKPKRTHTVADQEEQRRTINVNAFVNIVKKICESIDNLMQTYRVQVKKIQNSFEQKEKPSLLNECSALFNQIANLNKAVEANREATPAKVVNATEMLVESLENYGLTIKDGKVVSDE